MMSNRFELMPITGMQEAALALPAGATVTVTCSPRHGLERTLEATEWLVASGFHAVPHLAARWVRDADHLRQSLERLAALGIDDAFVVGGDVERPVGDYPHGLSLLQAMDGLALRPARVGIPAYPEGHHAIADEALARDLVAKAELADYAVTQMCFEADPLLAWRRRQARLGLSLPIYAGIPGVIEPRRLLTIAMRLGLGPSVRTLRRQTGWLGRLLRPSAFQPDALLEGVAPLLHDDSAGFAGLHVYTFNRVEPTLRWLEARRDLICGGAGDASAAGVEASAGEPLA